MRTITPDKSNDAGNPEGATLFLPRKERSEESGFRSRRTLPTDLKRQVARRLRVIALIYSAAFFLADLLPPLVRGGIVEKFQHPWNWMPTIFSILLGLLVAVFAASPRVSWETKVNLGLVFQVVASYGIALAMYAELPGPNLPPEVFHVLSPSWVAVWMMFYAVVVPAPPWRALLALTASASASPVVIGLVLRGVTLSPPITPGMFFFMHVFPYLICLAMAYVGTRVVFRLGTDVSRARDLGSYRLVERLGEGGMGEVWRASHQLLAREAAIKFVRPEALAELVPEEATLLLRRFELEARTTASLTSAHTIDLYDFGVSDGRFYYVMELLDGVDCDRLVRRFGPLPAARVIHVLRQICESLDEAHTQGLIHRDVKPANIYLCRSGRVCDFVKVLDFGLVAHRNRPSKGDLKLTMTNQAVGTPSFMPPEIALGRDVDGRADLYGLGCVAYWLTTGRAVFEGSSFLDVVSKHMHEAPEPPSRHAPEPLPPELEALILQCLEKAPEKRPASAREIGLRLRGMALQAWRDDQAEAWWQQNLAPRAQPKAREFLTV